MGVTTPPPGSTHTPITPGMALMVPKLLTRTTVPMMVGGRRTMVGLALGTGMSIVNCFLPVTMARASMRPALLPTTLYCEADLGSTLSGGGISEAANVSVA